MRTPSIRKAVAAFALVAAGATNAAAGWNADPVEVHATSALVPLVASVDDGNNGALIVWQETTPTGGLLRAKHVLATGDIDPATLTPTAVSSLDRVRNSLGAVSDGSGGAYVWWTENTLVMMTHVGANGLVTAGWAAGGRNLGDVYSPLHRPSVVADGSGGVYVGWLFSAGFPIGAASIRAQHLGVNGAAAGGWPAGGRSFGLLGSNPSVVSFSLAPASDGGLWLGWQTKEIPIVGFSAPGVERVIRLTPAGVPASGWTSSGVELAVYAPLDPVITSGQFIALAPDGADGVFVADGLGQHEPGGGVTIHHSLRHLDASGASFGAWDPAGVDAGDTFAPSVFDIDAAASLRALPDGAGGVYVATPYFGSGSTAGMSFARFDAAGADQSAGVGARKDGMESAVLSDGRLFIASFKPSGATGPNEADAYLGVVQSSGTLFFETAPSGSATRYGDIGLASTADGGAIFTWSQSIDRQGVYAIRLDPAGAVAGVNPSVGAASLRLRFVRGQGVLAVPSLPGAGRMALSLHDLAGRTVSSAELDGAPGAGVAFPGTRDLPGGVYFARAHAGGKELHARVVVVR